MNDLDRMKELIHTLNEAGKAYYQQNKEVMSNLEYDKMYDELLELEKKTNTVLSNSPTIHVGYELMTVLEKEAHPSPMLSLDKTKEPDQLATWLNGQEGILSWKLDGLTIVLTYEHGELLKAVTRGNGEVGEVVTNNARVFENVPRHIAYQGILVIRGEAIIPYSDFYKMNEEIEDVDSQYKTCFPAYPGRRILKVTSLSCLVRIFTLLSCNSVDSMPISTVPLSRTAFAVEEMNWWIHTTFSSCA